MVLSSIYKPKDLGITESKSHYKNAKLISILFIVVMSIAVNIPIFISNYYPIHDTLTVFHFFSHYYSEIMTNHEIPLWLPYTTYGLPIEPYILFSLGPFQYLSIAIGYLLNIQNTLNLFSISLIGDTLFLAFGAYLLCNHIFKDHLISCICVGFLLLLAQYDQQLYWNFKVLIPIPMALYFGQKWVESLNLVFLLAGFATLLITSFGSLPYALPLQFYIIACYCSILIFFGLKSPVLSRHIFMKAYNKMRHHLVQKHNIILITILLIIIAMCLLMFIHIKYVMTHEMANSENLGRDESLVVPLHTYLHHGGYLGWGKILEMLNGNPYCNQDILPFTGLICISFVIYGVIAQPISACHAALILTTLFVILFSVEQTMVAHLMYYLPKMNLFRHIAYVITVGKILLTILSGFGIRAYLHKK